MRRQQLIDLARQTIYFQFNDNTLDTILQRQNIHSEGNRERL